MKIHMMTDLECVAGVVTGPEYCLRGPQNKYGRTEGGRYYDHARRLATLEVNAAVDGLLEAGATDIVICDGHGHGGLDASLIHERARILIGLPAIGYGIDDSFDATIMIGQHAMANTDGGHLCHSGSFSRDAWLLNGQIIGEIGLFMLRATCHNVPMVMISGDVAACEEARQLVPSIETVAVIEGVKRGSTKGMTTNQALDFNAPAIHVSPEMSRSMIRDAARRCLDKIDSVERFRVDPPYEMVRITRPDDNGTVLRSVNRADDFLALDGQKTDYEPVDAEAQN
ncbi:MAG: hypothetical protein CMJ18_07445 [Phycisphaeraceae bacterium]|nr:hypothetical protein [Phycisphaeraceae bacterium]